MTNVSKLWTVYLKLIERDEQTTPLTREAWRLLLESSRLLSEERPSVCVEDCDRDRRSH